MAGLRRQELAGWRRWVVLRRQELTGWRRWAGGGWRLELAGWRRWAGGGWRQELAGALGGGLAAVGGRAA